MYSDKYRKQMDSASTNMLFAKLTKLPPSTNKLYELGMKTLPDGRKVPFKRLSTAAKKYQTWASTELAKAWGFSKVKLDPNKPHDLTVIFLLPEVENKGWATGKAKTRFKKKDVTNYIKLMEDIVASACGVDDSATFDTRLMKRLSTKNPRIEIYIKEAPEWILEDAR